MLLSRVTRFASAFGRMIFLCGSVCIVSSAYSQIVDVTDCRAITDSLARLVCYDGRQAITADTTSQATATASPPVTGSQGDAPTLVERGRGLPLVGRLFGTTEDAAQVDKGEAAGADQANPSQTTDVSRFGVSESVAARIQADEEGREELFDTISALRQDRQGNWRITLTSGQIWQQVFVKPFNLREGQQVRIYSTAWGESHRLAVEGLSGFIQVRRLDQPEG